MKKEKYKNVKAIIFNPENKTLNVEGIVDLLADQVETDSGVYPLENAVRYVDEWKGEICYVFNASMPEKVEAANIKRLRRSNALNRIFDYDRNKPMDIFKLMPYIIIIIMAIFGGN